jgi:glutamate racemase
MIGVFDSGHGGLTVLRALKQRIAGHGFAYLGDHAHAPYGERNPAEIYGLTVANVERLFGLGCRLVLLACNTAAAVALRRLQQDWLPGAYPERRVLGVFVPTIEAVTNVPWQIEGPVPAVLPAARLIGVFATRRTVESGAYPREIARRAPQVRVVQQACPGLVRHIEENAPARAIAPLVEEFVAGLLAQAEDTPPDSVILGCTHYPLVADAFAKALPPRVRLFAQPELVAASLADYLTRHPEFDPAPEVDGTLRFYTTGDAGRASALGSRFFGGEIRFSPLPAAG